MEGLFKKRGLRLLIIFLLVFSLLFIPLNHASAAKDELLLIPMGNTVGIKMESDGVIVVGLSEVDNGKEKSTPAAAAGIKVGDIITQLNSKKIQSVEDFKKSIAELDSKPATVRILRQGKALQLTLQPVTNKDGKPELGVWLRDGIVGIGTVTYMNPKDKKFGALGHSVSDIDTGIMLPLKNGTVMKSNIVSIIKGSVGAPGELQGSFDLLSSIGQLNANTQNGIFGTFDDNIDVELREAIPAAKRSEIKLGKAIILSNINGSSVEEYEIEISRIYPSDENGKRDMMITVKDPKLIAATGGIVQGMSGSPIIQNGKLIGAVTHVLVNDPCKGYAICIENMTKAQSQAKTGGSIITTVVFCINNIMIENI